MPWTPMGLDLRTPLDKFMDSTRSPGERLMDTIRTTGLDPVVDMTRQSLLSQDEIRETRRRLRIIGLRDC